VNITNEADEMLDEALRKYLEKLATKCFDQGDTIVYLSEVRRVGDIYNKMVKALDEL
jgi:argonaute-like protein implicated in RNA metabolism and viral defense